MATNLTAKQRDTRLFTKQRALALTSTQRDTRLFTDRRDLVRNRIIQNEAQEPEALTNVSSYTFSHISSGTNQLIVVHTFVEDTTASNRDITGVVYSNRALTKIREDINGNKETQLWSGAFDRVFPEDTDVVVSLAGTCAFVSCSANGYENADQNNPISGSAGGSGTGTISSVEITTVFKNDIAHDCVFGESTDEFSADYSLIGQNRIRHREDNGTSRAFSETEPKNAGTTLTMAWTRTNSNPWVMSVCTISAAFVQNLNASARDTRLITKVKQG